MKRKPLVKKIPEKKLFQEKKKPERHFVGKTIWKKKHLTKNQKKNMFSKKNRPL